jgi:hypothetical protein
VKVEWLMNVSIVVELNAKILEVEESNIVAEDEMRPWRKTQKPNAGSCGVIVMGRNEILAPRCWGFWPSSAGCKERGKAVTNYASAAISRPKM